VQDDQLVSKLVTERLKLEEKKCVVKKMSHAEKLKLKREVEQSEPKDTSEVYVTAVQDSPMQEPVQQNLAANYSPDIIPPSPPVPKPRKKSPLKAFNVFPKLTENSTIPVKNFKSPRSLQGTPNYLKHTTASKQRMSPRKKDVFVSPAYGVHQPSTDQDTCPRSGFGHSPNYDFLPKNKLLHKVGTSSSVDVGKVISPVGQYIRSNPVPPIVRQIRPKTTKRFDDDLAAFERDEELCNNQQSVTPQIKKTETNKRQFKPLPMATYKSSKVAFEQQIPSTQDEMKPLPTFGIAPTVEAKIIRHLGREKVPKKYI